MVVITPNPEAGEFKFEDSPDNIMRACLNLKCLKSAGIGQNWSSVSNTLALQAQ